MSRRRTAVAVEIGAQVRERDAKSRVIAEGRFAGNGHSPFGVPLDNGPIRKTSGLGHSLICQTIFHPKIFQDGIHGKICIAFGTKRQDLFRI